MYDKLASQLESKNISSKDWWKTFKILIRKDKTDPIPALVHNGFSVTDPSEKAIFLMIIFNYKQYWMNQINQFPLWVCNLAFISVETEEVHAILRSLTVEKACGPDNISNIVLKNVADVISYPLTDLYNCSLRVFSVPDIWKRAHVTPVHKKDDKPALKITDRSHLSVLSPKFLRKSFTNVCIAFVWKMELSLTFSLAILL